jgi:ribokinase
LTLGAACGTLANSTSNGASAMRMRLPFHRIRVTDAPVLALNRLAWPSMAARAARRMVATVRAIESLASARVEIDALVASAEDEGERYEGGDLDPPPLMVARTLGAAGGTLTFADGTNLDWDPAPLPGPLVDSYGAGDSFAACLTYALADDRLPQQAVDFAARCGAASMAGHGPYEGHLSSTT